MSVRAFVCVSECALQAKCTAHVKRNHCCNCLPVVVGLLVDVMRCALQIACDEQF